MSKAPSSAEFGNLPPTLYAERHGAVAVLKLNRPQKRNALDDATVLGLETFFASIPDGIGAVVLAGAGDNFSAGLDLAELSERDVVEGIEHSRFWHRVFERIEFGKVPVVAVLHGAVVGGGLEIAAAWHVRVAEASAFYALPENSRGIFVGGGGSGAPRGKARRGAPCGWPSARRSMRCPKPAAAFSSVAAVQCACRR